MQPNDPAVSPLEPRPLVIEPQQPPAQNPIPLPPAGEQQIVRTVTIVIAPLVVGVLAALFLAVPDQTREIYRIFARDFSFQTPSPKHSAWPVFFQYLWLYLPVDKIDLSWIGVTLAGILNWKLARNLTLEFARGAATENSIRGMALRWLPRLCGALIPFGAGTGLLLASNDINSLPFDVRGAEPLEQNAAINLRFMGVFLYLIAFALMAYAYFRTRNKRVKYVEANTWMFSTPAVLGIIGLTIGLIVLFATPITGATGIQVAWMLGTPALFCVFIMLLAYFSTGMSVTTFRTGVPVIPLLGLGVLLLAVADVNDNHSLTVTTSKAAVDRPSTREAFLAWYRSRADRSLYERARKPYPVFLVTAAGGGLYAADFAATALARLQDECPAFAQHLFAISGVSGGGVGAALFSTLVADRPQVRSSDAIGNDPCRVPSIGAPLPKLEERIGRLVSEDYLAPMAAAGLFPDFAQRFLPFAVERLDRSRAFETTLDLVWQRTTPGCVGSQCKPFSRPFLDTWRPDGTAPALVLNATNVDVGYRTILAPFVVAREVPGEYSALQNFHEALARPGPEGQLASGGDVSLGTAVGLSARFPWVMPPATVRLPDGQSKLRLLDGGIFENSGVDTLTDMLIDLGDLERPLSARLGQTRSDPWVAFHPIIISGYQLNTALNGSGFRGEALSPVSAMLSARVQRAGMASYRLFLQRGYDCGRSAQSEICKDTGIRFLVLNHEDFRLPLGWQLSTYSRNVVVSHVGVASDCDPIPRIRDMFASPSSQQRKQYTQRENNCTACSVLQALRGEPLNGSRLCKAP